MQNLKFFLRKNKNKSHKKVIYKYMYYFLWINTQNVFIKPKAASLIILVH